MRLVVVGDIHTQEEKLWQSLAELGLANGAKEPLEPLFDGSTKLILLGDLFHAKSRERYNIISGQDRYDEYNPEHVKQAESYQERFLAEVKAFYDKVPEGNMVIIMGNHDFNAISHDQGPLRTDDIAHLEWKKGYGGDLPEDIRTWVESWPYQYSYGDIHFAHVGPRSEHNHYDEAFYLENRRRWIYEDKDFMAETPYKLGVYGHTPVRGGVNVASKGRAILLDTNGHRDEYVYLIIEVNNHDYRLMMRGLFFDEMMPRI
ncbi:MAG: metallophosphoesterase [Deinococcales bacterium]